MWDAVWPWARSRVSAWSVAEAVRDVADGLPETARMVGMPKLLESGKQKWVRRIVDAASAVDALSAAKKGATSGERAGTGED
jgi:hypothetical protein